MFGLGFLGFSMLFSVVLCVHAVRSNQNMYWVWIILFLQPLGGVVYLIAIVLPQLFGGTRAKRLGMAAREALDPTREYRQAKQAVDETPTVHNRMRLAAAAAGLGRWAEAEQLYADAAHGIHADDPALLLGRATALVELGRNEEALELLKQLGEEEARARSPSVSLTLGRALEGLGRYSEADTAYQWAVGRLPGLEALARYSAFQARTGRKDEATQTLAEIDRRIAKANPQFRKEGRIWRDLAAQALARA
jgi:hypothetical protein